VLSFLCAATTKDDDEERKKFCLTCKLLLPSNAVKKFCFVFCKSEREEKIPLSVEATEFVVARKLKDDGSIEYIF
jgi:hypothetical protein